MTDSPTPQQVAEAKVEKVADTQWRVRAAAERWLRHDGVWSIWPLGGAYFPSESAARSALAAAQELAGVYARPEGRTCECVDLMLSEDVRKSQMVAVWPDGGIWHPINYDEWDRRYVWAFWERCRLCSRGVPKAPAAPGGEGKCPECGREKAASIQDVVGGLCPKWWAFRDPDAERDCLHYRVTIPAAPGGAARKVEPTPRMKAFAEALDKGPPEPGALAGSVPVAPAGPGGEGKDQTMQEKYESLIPAIRSAARSLGYAVGVHGSMNRDLDLIAVPWEGDAAPPTYLAEAVRLAVLEACGACYLAGRETGDKFCEDGKPGWKPHGRLCWTYYLGGEPYIDLSVMPRLDVQGSVTIPAAAIRKGDSNV